MTTSSNLPGFIACAVFCCFLLQSVRSMSDDKQNLSCSLKDYESYSEYMECVRSRRFKRFYDTPYRFREDYGDPCQTYLRLDQPERTVTHRIESLTSGALCDRALRRRWYRFTGPGGGIMPETCVEENRCGTHSPIWLNGKHPARYGDVADVEACASLAGRCCSRRWYIRVANCGEFYTYLLTNAPGCFMAYCAGNELPCPEGQSSQTGYTPDCSDNFPALTGRAALSMNTGDPRVIFFCDYEGPISSSSIIQVDWFVEGETLGRGDDTKLPIYTDEMIERRRSILTEGHWVGRMGSQVYCQMRAKWKNNTGVPSPALQSDKYFAGIKVLSPVVSVSESRDEGYIQLQSTVPVNCLPQFEDVCKITVELAHDPEWKTKQCADGRMNQIVFGDCKIDITNKNWRQVHNVSVKAVRDFYNDGNKKMRVKFKPVYSTYSSLAWNDYQLPDVEVLAKDAPTAVCASTGDPHYTTFDGHYYHVYLEGEFVLYKNTRLPYQINTRLEKCGKLVTCNCGVSVKAADDVIVIDRCGRQKRNSAYGKSFPDGWKTIHKHVLEQGDSLTNGLKIYEHDGGKKYTVHLPSGAYLDFHVGDEWINLFLHGSTEDFNSTLGLCGTFDRQVSTDFTMADGVTMKRPRRGESCGESPDVCEFAQSWRVSDEESLFGEYVDIQQDESKPVEEEQYCKCHQTREGASNIVCNYQYDVQNCEQVEEKLSGVDKTRAFLLRSRRRTRRSVEFTDQIDDDYFDSEFVYDKQYIGEEPQWPTQSGITESEARSRCYSAIMFSNLGRVCHRHVYNRLPKFLDSCITDIKVTDDYKWIQSSLDTLRSECVNHIHVSSAYWPDQRGKSTVVATSRPTVTPARAEFRTPGEKLLNDICPFGCSEHGRCVNRECRCDAGYIGSDCRISLQLPPKIGYIAGEGLCNIRSRPCMFTTVYGDNFRKDGKLECVFKEIGRERVLRNRAEFVTFEEIRCALPRLTDDDDDNPSSTKNRTHIAFLLSISQDNVTSLQSRHFIVYDSKCMHCTVTKSNYTCEKTAESCMIGGSCYAPYDTSPSDCCMICNPQVDTSTFVFKTEYFPPIVYPSQEIFYPRLGQDWYLTIGAIGCRVTYQVHRFDENLSSKNILEITADGSKVNLHSSGRETGKVQFGIKAVESCGSVTTWKNFTVHVLPETDHNSSSNCSGGRMQHEDSEDTSHESYTVLASEIFKLNVEVADQRNHTIQYFVLKSSTSYVSISDSGLFRYIAPSKPMTERVTVIMEDECGRRTYRALELKVIDCPCPAPSRCLVTPDLPPTDGLYECRDDQQ